MGNAADLQFAGTASRAANRRVTWRHECAAGRRTAQAATAARDLALGKLQTMNDRVRFYYC